MKIVFCQATYHEDFELTKQCIERVRPYVDAVVIAYDQTLGPEEKEWLRLEYEASPNKFHSVFFEFRDNLPEMRNVYLEVAKGMGADWICVSDPDELYSEELVKNLRTLIERHDILGFNLLPVHARDQFDNVEWLDRLDLLKETPGGYRETEFWKPLLIFKVSPDVHYEGVGRLKNVHEMLSTSKGWKSARLPTEYYYVHHKSAFKIWRNAARNMFIGGGGDNVGDLNPFWKPLKEILASHQIFTWPQFEWTVNGEKPIYDARFEEWIKSALQAPPTNWGTETRELAKWYLAQHKDVVTPELKELIDHPPVLSDSLEIENFVTRTYFEILGRHPDEEGRKVYTEMIKEGKMKREDLAKELMNSQEYKERRGGLEPVEQMLLKIPVDVSVNLTESLFVNALMRSNTFWTVIKPKLDAGGLFLRSLKGRKVGEFIDGLYDPIHKHDALDVAQWLVENLPKRDSVALCIMGYRKVLSMILKSIRVMADYVEEVHVQGDDFTNKDIDRIINVVGKATSNHIKVFVHLEEWKDQFSDYKNKALQYANTEWILILDHDEVPTPEMAAAIPKLVHDSERGAKYNLVSFDVIDQKITGGKVALTQLSKEGKPLLHWNIPSPYYGNPHIWLKPNYYNWKPEKNNTAYLHIKDVESELPRSVRNVFLGGGGDNSREGNPVWPELRKVCDGLGLMTWDRFDSYLKAGKISPDLLAVLGKLAIQKWKDNELQDPLKYYKQLHPEEFEGGPDK